MIEWVTVISLILFGLILIIAEIIFIPGTTIVGILGFLFLIVGVGFSFQYFGSETGWITVGISAAVSGLLLYYSFKSNVWGRFSSKSKIDSRVNEGLLDKIQVGNEGVTLSTLRPFGNAEVNDQIIEVKTFGNYLESGTKIRVVQINLNQIIVEQIN